MYHTAIDAARAHDGAAWRLRLRRRKLNFPNVWDAEEAAYLAPMPQLSTRTDRSLHRRRSLVGLAPEEELRTVADWYAANPRDYDTEEERWHTCEAERADRRAEREEEVAERRAAKAAAHAQFASADGWANDDPRWAALTEEISDTDEYSDYYSSSDEEATSDEE